jgi:hypothetical protein
VIDGDDLDNVDVDDYDDVDGDGDADDDDDDDDDGVGQDEYGDDHDGYDDDFDLCCGECCEDRCPCCSFPEEEENKNGKLE